MSGVNVDANRGWTLGETTMIVLAVSGGCLGIPSGLAAASQNGYGFSFVVFLSCLTITVGTLIRRSERLARERRLLEQAWAYEARENKLMEIATRATKQHMRTLRAKMRQLSVSDAYGNVDLSKFAAEIGYFITNVIFRDFKAVGYDPLIYKDNEPKLRQIYDTIVQLMADDLSENPDFALDDVLNGIDYELFCKQILENYGWQVSTTPTTGDQGADLIATNAGIRVAIQCKFYTAPVGNKAVQEACTSKAFHGADVAAVVSNAGFTPAARQLASANLVLLLHHHELPELLKRVSSFQRGRA